MGGDGATEKSLRLTKAYDAQTTTRIRTQHSGARQRHALSHYLDWVLKNALSGYKGDLADLANADDIALIGSVSDAIPKTLISIKKEAWTA